MPRTETGDTYTLDEPELNSLREQLPSVHDTVFVSGSRVEGLGNRHSDVDLVVIGDRHMPDQLLQRQHYVDWEFHSKLALINLADHMNALREVTWVSQPKLDLYYRTAIGVPLTCDADFQELQEHFSKGFAIQLYGQASRFQAQEYLREGKTALDCHDYLCAYVWSRAAQERATNAYLADHGEGYPHTKWRFEKARRRFGAESAVYKQVWDLRNIGDHSVVDYVGLVTEFCAAAGIRIQRPHRTDPSLTPKRLASTRASLSGDSDNGAHAPARVKQAGEGVIATRTCDVTVTSSTCAQEGDSLELRAAQFNDRCLGSVFRLMYDIAGASADRQWGMGVEQCRRVLYAAVDARIADELVSPPYVASVTSGPEVAILRWRRICELWGISSALARDLAPLERAAPLTDDDCATYIDRCKVFLQQHCDVAVDYSKRNLKAMLEKLSRSSITLSALGSTGESTLQLFGLQAPGEPGFAHPTGDISEYVDQIWREP